ncbi:hypothetical protein TPR58_13005 [Sphingomonas sp. HF-S3]|uniref:Polysaccharide polymerase n=1 Tax=Sphingomonas rustica TaxID=3103142 RepID=A0ABV0B937_9SPHN
MYDRRVKLDLHSGRRAAFGARAAVARVPVHYWVFVLLLVFTVAMPKAGIGINGTPLTFGYMLLAAFAPVALVGLFRRPDFSAVPTMNLLLGYLPISLFVTYKLLSYGTILSLIVLTTILAVLPLIILLAYAPYLEDFTEDQIGAPIKWCIRIVVIWGLMNFFLYALTKNFIEINYLTINQIDLGAIYSKNNRRGVLMKLVSTYNNGNLLGSCLIMMAPVYLFFEKSRAFIAAFCLAIVLTLSRTAWFGLAAVFSLLILFGRIRLTRPFIWLGVAAAVMVVIIALPYMGWTSDRVVDVNLGGRLVYWSDLSLSLFGARDVRIYEILYASFLQSFGVVGFALALTALGFPLVYGLINLKRLSPLRVSALLGVCAYLLVAFFDAAFIYPPTIAQFLFLSALLYRRGYRGDRVRQAPVPTVPRRGMTLAEAGRRI